MSNNSNTELLELAHEHSAYWAGEGIGVLVDKAIDDGDLEALNSLLIESAQYMYEYGMQVHPTTPEQAEAMYVEQNDAY